MGQLGVVSVLFYSRQFFMHTLFSAMPFCQQVELPYYPPYWIARNNLTELVQPGTGDKTCHQRPPSFIKIIADIAVLFYFSHYSNILSHYNIILLTTIHFSSFMCVSIQWVMLNLTTERIRTKCSKITQKSEQDLTHSGPKPIRFYKYVY